MPRFVLLYHACPPSYSRPSHWDFMLEVGNVLRTWALEQLPNNWKLAHHATHQTNPDCPPISDAATVAAEKLDDHRRAYLELEGEVRGNRGRVTRIAEGTYQLEIDLPAQYRVLLNGDRIQGRIELTRADATDEKWSVACTSTR